MYLLQQTKGGLSKRFTIRMNGKRRIRVFIAINALLSRFKTSLLAASYIRSYIKICMLPMLPGCILVGAEAPPDFLLKIFDG